MKIIKNNIKLVIWDLDETFWSGTLSEGVIEPIDSNIKLVDDLTKRGIINSISSKNTYSEAKAQIEKLGIWDSFVFPQISWNPKGQIIKDLIENMNLRADNVLFIDDNVLNLNEALFFSPKLNVCLPEFINSLLESEFLKGKDDFKKSRLKQYKNLEKKHVEFSESNKSNIDFLKGSLIQVKINTNCTDELKRIHELVNRTNQLNFTKRRISLEELKHQLEDVNTSSGYIQVTDKYGDYGISGFYLLKDNELLHFLFSCRTMNMYVESWVYQHLGSPDLKIQGEVAVKLDSEIDLSFINQKNIYDNLQKVPQEQIDGNSKILLMGGCDLDQTVVYLNHKKLSSEFNYPNSLNINVHKDHTYLVKQFKDIYPDFVNILKTLAVLDVADSKLKIHTEDWDILIFSPLNDYSRGLYKHKMSGFILPFEPFNINWTDEKHWKTLPAHLKTLPISFLKLLKSDFDFIGSITPKDFEANIQWLLDTYRDKKFIFLNGSEVEFKSDKFWEKDMRERHILMNQVLKSFELRNSNVRIVDVNKFTKSSLDLKDNIRHYNKEVYKLISDEIISLSKDWLQSELKTNSNLKMNFDTIKGKTLLRSKRLINKIRILLKNH
jgi:FkbH-like protein